MSNMHYFCNKFSKIAGAGDIALPALLNLQCW